MKNEFKITDAQIADGCNEAYLRAGHNAYFGNGFNAGVEFALKLVNGADTEQKSLHIDGVMQSALPDTPDDEIYDAAAELYKAGKMLNATLLVKRHTTMDPAQAKIYCDAHFA